MKISFLSVKDSNGNSLSKGGIWKASCNLEHPKLASVKDTLNFPCKSGFTWLNNTPSGYACKSFSIPTATSSNSFGKTCVRLLFFAFGDAFAFALAFGFASNVEFSGLASRWAESVGATEGGEDGGGGGTLSPNSALPEFLVHPSDAIAFARSLCFASARDRV